MPDEYDDELPPRGSDPLRADSEGSGAGGPSEADGPDGLLSALIDGELAGRDASALRERIARQPALAERLAQLEQVDGALRALSAPRMPTDLAARMRERIASQQRAAETPVAARMPSAPPRRVKRLWPAAAAGLAAAAAVAFYLVLSPASIEIPVEQSPAGPASLLANAADDELGIALYYDELADLEMLEQLELLEILAAIEEAEQS